MKIGASEAEAFWIDFLRSLARRAGRAVGVLVDLQGPKIRIGRFREGKVTLKAGAKFILDAEGGPGDHHCVGLDYRNLPNDVRPGDTLLLGSAQAVAPGSRIRVLQEAGR